MGERYEDTARELAEAATQGRWKRGNACLYIDTGHAVGDPEAPDTRFAVLKCRVADARLIAAHSPDVVRALAEVVGAAREAAWHMDSSAQRDDLREALARLDAVTGGGG